MFLNYFVQLDSSVIQFLNYIEHDVLENLENLNYKDIKGIRLSLQFFKETTIKNFQVIMHYDYAKSALDAHLKMFDKLNKKLKKQQNLMRPIFQQLLALP
jgi:hypothetical protein